ncbi:exopolygalacturonase-like [Syzygium oleosum]|uniref:exopolygalacturonase-like n=1 Tax=Syzygium oleosum TaxID=219896 RepID=UPI0011D1D2DE|nr:exopolygalacturonase-like [Syzygium oleosum]
MGSKMMAIATIFLYLFSVAAAMRTRGFSTRGPAEIDVKKFGAKADGRSDDSQIIMSAWQTACTSPSPSSVVISKGSYMAGPLKFQGPCKADVNLKVEGTIKAPSDLSKLKSQGAWVLFQNVDGLTLSGGGSFDGQGAVAWKENNCAQTGKCNTLPTNLQFTSVTNSHVQDITSLNSKLFHVELLNCKNVTLQHVTIDAPEDSLNTDGIHVGRSTGVNITGADIRTGDDCISLGDGSQQVHVEGVTCGPGHGISVGSLGKYHDEQPVVGVTVRNCTLTNTMNGIRVKTWPNSPSGVATNMRFEDITVKNVSTPILIDQNYCPYNNCQQKLPSKVKISNVSFRNIRGTSATALAVKLVCSRGVPCQKVELADINLKYYGKNGTATSHCANVKPTITGKLSLPICAGSQG